MVKTEQLVLPQLILKSDLTEKSVKGGVFQTKSLPQCSVGINSGFQPHRLLTHVVMWASFQVQPRRSATTRVIPYVTPNYMLEWYAVAACERRLGQVDILVGGSPVWDEF